MNRSEAIEDLKTLKKFFEQESGAFPISLEYAIEVLENDEVVRCKERKNGEWIAVDEYCNHAHEFKCTACGQSVYYDHYTRFCEYDFCPNCGADMRAEQTEPQTDCSDLADRLAYERGVKHAWKVAQKVFSSTVTFYEAEDVAKQIANWDEEVDDE